MDYGSPAEHAFDWAILAKNWDTTLPALLGIGLLILRLRQDPRAMLPLVWLALSLLVFTNHKPWWAYYYIHIAIRLCWCAAIAIEWVYVALQRWTAGGESVAFTRRGAKTLTEGNGGNEGKNLGSSVFFCKKEDHLLAERRTGKRPKGGRSRGWRVAGAYGPAVVLGLCAMAWMGARVYLQIAGMRESPQLYTALVLKEIERLKPFSHWMYTDQLVYSFHSDLSLPPPLAVVPLKRLWSGEMTSARIAAEMARFKPEVILLRNDTREVPFQALLASDYRLIYEDEHQRLYADRGTIQRADSSK